MSKPVKAMISSELRTRYAGVNSVCVVGLAGLNVQQQEKLRATLRAQGSKLEVVKNSLAKQAFADTLLAPIGAALKGPCALVVAIASPIETAKLLVRATAEFERLELKQAMIDGDPNLLSVEHLSKMVGRMELLGMVAMLVSSPGRALAACIASPQARLAGCIKAIAGRGESQQAT